MKSQTVFAKFIFAAVFSLLSAVLGASLIAAQVTPARGSAQGEFFIVSSVNLQKQDLFVKAPTEVTEEMTVTPRTVILSEQGKHIPLSQVRAGDTVYVVSRRNSQGFPEVVRLQQGPMTVGILHARYLNYK
jgi:phosphohistidine swiveling domain-containing protein